MGLFSWRSWLWLVVLVGVISRFVSLDYKVVWHDEVYTSLRSSGYSSLVVSAQLFSDRLTNSSEILQYQQIKPDSSIQDTIVSLAQEDPQHPPLYFLVNRWWMELFGSSVMSVRLLPALLSTLGILFMYLLAEELFNNHLASWLASAFFALSPFDILFAQISRQYSLLTLMVIVTSYLLLRSLRLHKQWWIYSLGITIGLYTHPFFAFTIFAHGGYILAIRLATRDRKIFRNYLLTNLVAILLYSPWLMVMFGNLSRVLSTTNWTGASPDWLFVPKLWILSFSALFLDLDVGFDNPFTYVIRLPFLILFWWGMRSLFANKNPRAGLFLLANFAVPFLILVIPDLITGGRRSSVSRYLISCFPAIQLAIAYLFSQYVNSIHKIWWRTALGICFALSIASITVSAFSNTWWTNVPSYFNGNTAQIINQSDRPLLIVDQGYDGTNFGDLISLAYRIKPDVPIYLADRQNKYPLLERWKSTFANNLFVFRPSGEMRSHLAKVGRDLMVVDQTGGDLWRIESNQAHQQKYARTTD